ncbi:DNA polymerase III subunit gamma/tau [Emergencia timonensis]|uniref:DNA polymerase III subunit gamma/tau n=1 Tax=Emergencia timonensis TaxID=1776384 RepID=UPI000835766C|nr:DNA polymerase III subunit gamma/tau [Emergencia timonensis]WNX88437.1 DNA polymerase III subunit gamma/tau [Emergencia timonensis]
MYTALYRAQRPEIFSEVIGQDHIVRILKNQIATDSVSHAYLFCGTRGTGKTTTARILAKAVNCLDDEDRPCGHCANCIAIKEGTFMDVVEIDAASNNGVDNIRELRESVKYPPAVGRKKVYIIDEVHMLSTGAFNALLKTLEEPPENVMFILATTDPQKLPQTILSRCMRLDFKRVPEKVLIDHMSRICSEKGVQVTDSALRLLAANADGSVRDGLSILDQCLAGGEKELDRDTVLEFLGTVSEEFFLDLTDRVSLHDVAGALVLLDEALQEGKDVKQLMKDWMSHYRSLLITKYIKNAEDMLNMSSENIEKLRNQSNQVSLDEINHGIVTLSRTINDARYSTQPRILLELAIVTIASGISAEAQAAPRMTQTQGRPQVTARPKKATAAKPAAEPTGQTGPAGAERAPQQSEAKDFDGNEYDLEEVWARIFAEGEGLKGSFNLIRTGTTLAAINGEEFKIIAQNEFTKQYVEANQMHICDLMEKIVGRRLKLVCRTENQREDSSPDQDVLNLAQEVSAKLGLDVKVE